MADNWSADSQQLLLTSERLIQVLGSLISENLVTVKKGKYWIELQMNSELLFLSGSAELAKKIAADAQKGRGNPEAAAQSD